MEGESTPNAQPQVETPKKKGRKGLKLLLFGFIFVTCLVILLLLAGVTYAFSSNKNVPVFSSVLEGVENVVATDDMVAETVQDDISDMVFSEMLTLVDGGNPAPSLLKADFTEEDLNSFIKEKLEYETQKYQLNLVLNLESEATQDSELGSLGLGMNGKITVNANGEASSKKDDERASAVFDANYEAEGTTLSANGEIRSIGNVAYVKLDSIPTFGLFDLSSLQGEWMSLDASTLPTTDETQEPITITKNDLQTIYDFIHSDEIKKTITRTDDEVIEGVRTNCFEMDLSTENLKSIFTKLAEITDEEMDEEELDSMLEGLDSLIVSACSGRKDGLLYKVKVSAVFSDESGVSGNLVGDVKMWDYDEDVNIEQPEDSIPLEDAMEQLYGSFGDFSTEEESFESFEDDSWLNDYNYDLEL